jgi:DUF971 family protein
MIEPPAAFRALTDKACIEIEWRDGTTDRLPFRFVRGRCPCARCVDEMTGVRTLDVNTIPADVALKQVEPCGNYAVKIVWSDGHESGLFTWEYLAELGRDESLANVKETS